VAAVVLGLIVLLALIGPLFAPYSPLAQDFSQGNLLPPGSHGHLLGTDQLARDILSRAIYGLRTSLFVSIVAVAISVGVGSAVGILCGYRGGAVDAALMRLMDALLSFPTLVLALVIAVSLGPSLRNTIFAIGVVGIPGFSRLVRAQTQRIMGMEYVTAAKVTGSGPLRISAVHIVPNIIGPIVGQAVLALGYAIPAEATLSFLGLGVQPPSPSLGNMISDGYVSLGRSPWVLLVPAVLVMLTVASSSLVADELLARLDR
jgi:ABC-type dipeptide/oligopeptide/nickel transport system permease subunit